MKNPCEIVVLYFLPACRSMIARELIEDHHLTQVDAAKKLGTTQAAISYYLSSKRGEKYIKQLEENPEIQSKISAIAKEIATEDSSATELMLTLCNLCTSLRNNDLICTLHKSHTPLSDTCQICFTVK